MTRSSGPGGSTGVTVIERDERRTVGVVELKRAWEAVASGAFRPSSNEALPATAPPLVLAPGGAGLRGRHGDGGRVLSSVPAQVGVPRRTLRWETAPDEIVVPVLGCVGSCGASTLALAIATVARRRARVLECAADSTSGLVGASTAELGLDSSGWVRGTRGDILIERAMKPSVGIEDVPIPTSAAGVELTVVDVGSGPTHTLTGDSWLADLVRRDQPTAMVTTATIPGLRRLEATLADLAVSETAVVAVLGPIRRAWPGSLTRSAGPLTRAVDRAGRLAVIPVDRGLAVAGVDSTPLPQGLLAAAGAVLDLIRPHVREHTR